MEKSVKQSAKKVKIYTTSTCPWCMKTKEFFKENNVKYEEANVGTNEEARNEMFQKSGQLGVPVVVFCSLLKIKSIIGRFKCS